MGLMEKVIDCIDFDRPDGYIKIGDIVYCVEHFEVSPYKYQDGNLAKKADAVEKHMGSLLRDYDYNLEPSLENLLESIKHGIKKHIENTADYLKNVKTEIQGLDYRLAFLLHDVSKEGVYNEAFDTKPRNPLLFDMIANEFLNHADSVWAIIYVFGNQKKEIWGATIQELSNRRISGELLDFDKYQYMHCCERIVITNKELKEYVHLRLGEKI